MYAFKERMNVFAKQFKYWQNQSLLIPVIYHLIIIIILYTVIYSRNNSWKVKSRYTYKIG